MKKLNKIVSLLLCGAMVLSCGFTSLAAPKEADTAPAKFSIPTNVEVIPLKNDASSLKAAEVLPQPKNDMGQPRDVMKFYYIRIYPLVKLPDGNLAYLNFTMGMDSPGINLGGAGPSLSGSYTKAETQQIYNDIADTGYDLVGWHGEIKFRFDYITPYTWTHTLYGGSPITERVPLPHNPYQTYIFTFNTGLPADINYNGLRI